MGKQDANTSTNKNAIKNRYGFKLSFLHPRYWLTLFGLALFFIITFFPMPIIDWLGCRFGDFAARSNKKRFNIATKNLSLCFPDKTESEIRVIVEKHFQAQFRSLFHYCILWWRPISLVRNRIRKLGFEKIEEYRAQGKNVIILLPHYVGLEFAVAGISMDNGSIGLYKAMRNPVVNWVIANGRLRFGKNNGGAVVSREEGMRPLIREMRKGKILIYLADEDLGADKSIFAPFYGVPKATVPVLGRLAKSCNAVVLTCSCCYQSVSRQYELKLFPAMQGFPSGDDEVDSLNMNKAVEQAIEQCPVEYLWTLKYFKTRPPGEASVYD